MQQIISVYAPPNENDTDAYVTAVCQMMGVGPDDRLQLNDPAQLASFCRAIAVHEAGGWMFSDDDLMEGVRLALEPPTTLAEEREARNEKKDSASPLRQHVNFWFKEICGWGIFSASRSSLLVPRFSLLIHGVAMIGRAFYRAADFLNLLEDERPRLSLTKIGLWGAMLTNLANGMAQVGDQIRSMLTDTPAHASIPHLLRLRSHTPSWPQRLKSNGEARK